MNIRKELKLVVVTAALVCSAGANAERPSLSALPPTWSSILSPDQRFLEAVGGGGYLDRESGLVWQALPSGIGETWELANRHCLNLGTSVASTEGGGIRKGWRLPAAEELMSFAFPKPPIDLFSYAGDGVTPANSYWTATSQHGFVTNAYLVQFGDHPTDPFRLHGTLVQDVKSGTHLIWCVRGGRGYDGQ